jgi:hypothetical protein
MPRPSEHPNVSIVHPGRSRKQDPVRRRYAIARIADGHCGTQPVWLAWIVAQDQRITADTRSWQGDLAKCDAVNAEVDRDILHDGAPSLGTGAQT